MKYTYKINALIVGLCMALLPLAGNATTLSDAMVGAYNNNPQLQAERKRLMATDELTSQAFSGWLPTVTADVSRGKENTKNGNSNLVRNVTRSAQVNLSQPIFNGGETVATTKRANNLVKAGRQDLRQIEQDTLLAAVSAYTEVVRATEIHALTKHNEKVLKKHLDATEERFMLGEVTRTDVAQAKARLAIATSERIRAEGNLESSRAVYKRVVGDEAGKVSMPRKLTDIPVSLDDALAISLTASPILKAAEYNELAAKNNVTIQKAGLLPDLSIDALSRRESGGFSFGGNDFDRDSISVNLSVPLYQSGAQYSQVRQAKRNSENRRFLVREAENETVENVTRAWHDLLVARSTIVSNKEAVKAAEVALKGVEQEAEVGSRTTLDVLDAEQEAFNARVNLVQAQSDEVIAVYNLKSVIGKLDAKEIALDVDVYDADANQKNVRYKVIGF